MQNQNPNEERKIAGEKGRPGTVTPTTERRAQGWRRSFAQLRVKLTLPYAFLAVVVAFAATWAITRLLIGLLDDRFQTALLEAGKKAADTVVRVEQEQLAVWRAMAYTEGVAEAVASGEGDEAGLLISPLAVNARIDCVELVDTGGGALLAMHHRGGGVTDYAFEPGRDYLTWELVRKVLAGEVDEAGDKYADLVKTDWGWVFYTAGPIKQEGKVVGVLLVGSYLDNLVRRISTAALADISIYTGPGTPLVTTLSPDAPEVLAIDEQTYRLALALQGEQVPRRDVEVAGRGYAELFGAFEARHGRDLGLFSIALPLSFITDARSPTRQTLLLIFVPTTLAILVAGALLASVMVRRVRRLADATRRVAQGDLSTHVQPEGYDEVAALAEDFNRMVIQLRQGQMYRDLLGLTASPEVAERLHQSLEQGRLQLEAQAVTATVLFCDIRGFTRLSEDQSPEHVVRLLNDYMRGVVKVIREHNGIINKFVGDAALAFFGVLPENSSAAESAHDGVAAALALLNYLSEFNHRRRALGEPALKIGVGVNTGPVVAGVMGAEERLEYTVLGDTVNVAQRLSDLNKEFPDCDIFISAQTYQNLNAELKQRAIHIGETAVKGRAAPVDVYAVRR